MEQQTTGKNENIERGKNVEIVLKFIRHGERDKGGRLTDYGRDFSAKTAAAAAGQYKDFDAVKAIGSEAGKKGGAGARALETADIFANEIDPTGKFNTRASDALNYENLVSSVPYNHIEIYDANLPPNFSELGDAEKSAAAKKAQRATLNHILALDTPEAIAYFKEAAGAFAYVLEHYMEVALRLKSGSKVLIPAGGHGGNMELLLRDALVQEDEGGNKKVGFKTIEEIGGEFDPSDSYNIDIQTDEEGSFKELKVTFAKDRPVAAKLYLDREIVRALAAYYESLHDGVK